MLESVCYDIETEMSDIGNDSKYLETIKDTYNSGYGIGIQHGFFFGFTFGVACKCVLDKVMDYYK